MSTCKIYHSLRAGETDGVEANSQYLQITGNVGSLLDTHTATDRSVFLCDPLCWYTEREVQAKAAAASGLQQHRHCEEMLQKGI